MVKKTPWYVGGLHFECVQCGACCSGPSEGYIWLTRPEIEIIADFLKITPGRLRREYLRRVGLRTSIIENRITRDCIFLNRGLHASQRKCTIYPVRPGQCRSWPFWPDNLTSADAWNKAARKCPGINRGRLYSCEEIQKVKKLRKWWLHPNQKNQIFETVAEIYRWLDSQISDGAELAGVCDGCGKCCDFESFEHRLFVTTPELMYLAKKLGVSGLKPMVTSRCPYNTDGRCTIYEYRFAGCRIFCCKGDKDFQSRLSESALKKFKSLCTEFQIPYCYADLPAALGSFMDS